MKYEVGNKFILPSLNSYNTLKAKKLKFSAEDRTLKLRHSDALFNNFPFIFSAFVFTIVAFNSILNRKLQWKRLVVLIDWFQEKEMLGMSIFIEEPFSWLFITSVERVSFSLCNWLRLFQFMRKIWLMKMSCSQLYNL